MPAIEGALTVPGAETRDYRWYLIERGMAAKTVTTYFRAIIRADAWCEERGYPLRTVPGPVIAEYSETLPKSWSSRRQLRSALGHYWALFERRNAPLWAIRVPKKSRMVCRALEPDEALRLSDCAVARGDKAGLAVLVGLYQGFRRQEVASMRWDDLTDDGWLKVVGKGDLPAKTPLHGTVAKALTAAREQRAVACSRCGHEAASPWVFPARAGDGHVNPSTVWTWVASVAEEAGIENMTTHRLRHTCLPHGPRCHGRPARGSGLRAARQCRDDPRATPAPRSSGSEPSSAPSTTGPATIPPRPQRAISSSMRGVSRRPTPPT